jgi:5'-nucleotidase/UDP-sugar diphosphatase
MKRIYLFALVLLLGCSPSHLSRESTVTSFTILHWNDFHAQNVPMKITKKTVNGVDTSYFVGGTATLLGYIDSVKRGQTDVALLNAGDDFQGTPISSITHGRSQIELMNIINPDIMTLGNHEFDYGIDSLRVNVARAQYPLVCANIFDSTTNTTLVPAYSILSIEGVKLGVIGLTPPDLEILTIKHNLRSLSLIDVDRAVETAIAELRTNHQPDLIVVLSHMGLDKDTILAARRSDIDIIVGGHSHTALFQPVKKNRTIVVQAGSRGQYLGKLDLLVDLEGDSVVNYTGKLIETRIDAVTPNPTAAAKVEELESKVDDALNEVIGTLVTPWDRKAGRREESNLGNWECDVVRQATNTDIAFLNSAGIRKNLDAGPIKIRDIWEINPFGNTLVTFAVRGDTLRKMVEWQAGIQSREFMQVSGLKYRYDSSKPQGQKLVSIEVMGKPVVDTKLYTIVTNNYVASHLSEFFGTVEKSVNFVDTGIVDRDVFIEYIREKKTISAAVEGRIMDVGKK